MLFLNLTDTKLSELRVIEVVGRGWLCNLERTL